VAKLKQPQKRPVRRRTRPRCIVIAGPNGAGKTTFARAYLLRNAKVVHFINADLIASGLSPLDPRLAAVAAGRLVLAEMERLALERRNFAFESTLSGRAYAQRLQSLKDNGYDLEIVYLKLNSVELALQRVATRVRQGGHDIPAADLRRRFHRSWQNFCDVYRPLANRWAVYENSSDTPKLLEKGP
jgi:predicted ABC-type ATPase